uniref:Reverse transcriptase domain-containing protein n=1 Tax=Tanacetum cinerariifolium TaxID=118510 RepID=A0A6L2LQ07_TANCI|nr:hypothetical protein [Tanacetum cinerariifolium]
MCERCGNDLRDRFCSLCNSINSCAYDPNLNSFDSPPDSYHPPHHTYETYSCESCGNDSHFSYDCPPWFPLNYEPEPGYIENYNSYPHDSPSFPQQYLCYENCEGPRENFQCQPMNQNFYKPNLCYNSISSDFDQFQHSQFPVIHQPPQEMSIQDMEDLKQQYLYEMKSLINSEYRNEIKINELKGNFNGMSIEINKKKKIQQLEHVANLSTYPSQHFNSFCYEDDDDEDYTIAITPEFLDYGLSKIFTISKSFSDEDVPKEIYSNPLFDEEIISIKIDPHHFNAEFELIESLLNQDSSIISSPKIDSLLEEFFGELAHIDLIPPGINEIDFDPEEEIRLVERLLYDNSSPRPMEEPNFENSDAVIESFSPFPIPVEDSDPLMEEINLFLTPDDSMPPGIKNDDYDSEGDILFFEELLMIPLHFLKMSHFILMFHHPLVLLQNHRMMMKLSPIQDF